MASVTGKIVVEVSTIQGAITLDDLRNMVDLASTCHGSSIVRVRHEPGDRLGDPGVDYIKIDGVPDWQR